MFLLKGIIFPITVVVMAVLYNIYGSFYDSTGCNKDPPIHSLTVSPGQREYIWKNTCELFSDDYVEARDRFRAAIQAYRNVERFSIPIATKDDGQHQEWTIDIAIFPGNSQKYGTIVLSSGTHGVEGYAGSAIQLALLQQKDILNFDDEKEHPTVVLMHAINPVGMSMYRRFNENNVDLNRNGIPGNFQHFIQERDPNIASYDDFRGVLGPTDEDNMIEPSLWYNMVGFWLALIPKICRYGSVALKRAIVSGQYHHPTGIFFGGQELQPSYLRLGEFWDSRPDVFRDAASMIWIDVHTGLGPSGKDSMHYSPKYPSNGEPASFPLSAEGLEDQLFSTCYSATPMDVDDPNSKAFAGYGLNKGSLSTYFAERFDRTGLFVTQEFGTLPGILVARGMILDNMLYQQYLRQGKDLYSYRSPFLKYVFYPQSTSWRSSVIRRGVAMMLQAIKVSTDQYHGEE